jgi:2-polyprenyl-3-methyl-5-hydroxy-6-metoxy-1,4-benzoquinol methylase
MDSSKKNFNLAASTWDEKNERAKLAHDVAQTIIVTGIVKSDMEVLDFGCGTGLLSLQLQPLVRSITAVDSSEGMLEVFCQKIENQHLTNIRTRLLDIENGDSLEGSYDLIVSSMTLHHIKDIAGLLEHFKKVIKRNGCLCLADLDSDDGLFHRDNTGVFHSGFDRESLGKTMKKAGFDIVDIRTAAEMRREIEGGERVFNIFLISARNEN